MKRIKQVDVEELAKYADQWIAFSKDRTKILASGKTFTALHNKLEKEKVNNIIMHYVPPLNVTLTLKCQ